jgi:small subunit ribosomal protein S1
MSTETTNTPDVESAPAAPTGTSPAATHALTSSEAAAPPPAAERPGANDGGSAGPGAGERTSAGATESVGASATETTNAEVDGDGAEGEDGGDDGNAEAEATGAEAGAAGDKPKRKRRRRKKKKPGVEGADANAAAAEGAPTEGAPAEGDTPAEGAAPGTPPKKPAQPKKPQRPQRERRPSERPSTERAPFHVGEEVFGKVTGVLDTAIMIDLSGKALAIFDRLEMEADDLVPSVGDRFVARVHNDGARGGLVVLTRKPLREEEAKVRVQKALDDGTLVQGLVTGPIKGGVEVDIDGLRAFAPASGTCTRATRTSSRSWGSGSTSRWCR